MECRHLAKGSIYLLFEHMSLVMKNKFQQFMLLCEKKKPGKRTIGHCKTTNGFNFFFTFFKQT